MWTCRQWRLRLNTQSAHMLFHVSISITTQNVKSLPLMKHVLAPHFLRICPGSASPPDTKVFKQGTRSGSTVPRTEGVRSDQLAFSLRIAPARLFILSSSDGTQTVAPTVNAERISIQLASNVYEANWKVRDVALMFMRRVKAAALVQKAR